MGEVSFFEWWVFVASGMVSQDEFGLTKVATAWVVGLSSGSLLIGLLGGGSCQICTWLTGLGLVGSKVRKS